ncbi:MAG: relaxase/mobilization nuclease and DUF3363 domain-containing protein [Rhodospirillaceae bacterium]|nr:relaxase/mobilization nuclease and DUF3363 domain-containing protein [Rhodospirillaceae bacterium]
MSNDDDFTPKLGKIRAQGSKSGKKYLHQVLRAVAMAGGKKERRSAGKGGKPFGRGAGAASVLGTRDRYAAYRQRRVVIKTRIVKIKDKGLGAARAHLRYIQRDGVQRDGSPGELYGRDADRIDGKAFLERCEGDRHQFRFIVSAEDSERYEDLKPFVRRLMARMEQDLGTKLDWVAVDHYNTGHPHSHVVLRGKDDRDRDLVIARDYLSRGMRERAAEIVSFDLGPRTDLDVEQRLHREVEQERFTSLDWRLQQGCDDRGVVVPHSLTADAFQQTCYAGRLQKLKRLGLGDEIAPGTWRLSPDFEARLRELGLRGDIIKTMHRELGGTRAPADCAIYNPADAAARPIVGRVAAKGLTDEITDRRYLIIEAADGYAHYVDAGILDDEADPIREGSIVTVSPKSVAPRAADRTVAEVAAANGGRYSVDIHLRHDPTATAAFAETHVRRLEAMRRLTQAVDRTPEGVWLVAPDHLERAAAYERKRAQFTPVVVEILSRVSIERQATADGATWLDGELVRAAPTPLRDAGFGREVRDALARRRLWLMEQHLAEDREGSIVYRANLLSVLRRRELARVGAQLSDELGLRFADVREGHKIAGTYRRPVDLVSGRFALIETRSKEFSLVPWRPVLERSLGKEVSGIMRGDGVSWTIGRTRGMSR